MKLIAHFSPTIHLRVFFNSFVFKLSVMRLSLLICCLSYFIAMSKLYAGIADTTQIPILAWGGVPPHEASAARYEEMKNAEQQ